jgi:hypothetical protein
MFFLIHENFQNFQNKNCVYIPMLNNGLEFNDCSIYFFSRVRACKTRQQKERERNGKKTSFSVPTIFSQKRVLALLRVRKVRRQTNERTNVPLLFDFIFRPRFHFFLLFVFPFPSPSLE